MDRAALKAKLQQRINGLQGQRKPKPARVATEGSAADGGSSNITTTNGGRTAPISPASVAATLRRFPAWIQAQFNQPMIRKVPAFATLWRFDLTDYELLHAPEFNLGTRFEILFFKVNGAVYYESSNHLLGLKHELNTGRRSLIAHPARDRKSVV